MKKLVNYILRFSLAATLARKYKTSVKKIFAKYGKNFSVKINDKGKVIEITNFPSKSEVDTLKHKFNTDVISYSESETKKYTH